MASYEHKQLADYIKHIHVNLRIAADKVGTNNAWKEHCSNKNTLLQYAKCMEKLATEYWEESSANSKSLALSRIQWSADLCCNYFIKKDFIKCRKRDLEISEKLDIKLDYDELYLEPLKLLDVGSCYNPFRKYSFLDVLAIDLCPANEHVIKCDFIDVPIGDRMSIEDSVVKELKETFFDVVTFCFFLEYLPVSEMRIVACKNAYKLLKPGGLLIINTPDSKHAGSNCKLIKCWQYTLACLGFTRIKYEKLKHMHCMGFRKALDKEIAVRWATLHKKPHFEIAINIPQDFGLLYNVKTAMELAKIESSDEDLKELPFYNVETLFS